MILDFKRDNLAPCRIFDANNVEHFDSVSVNTETGGMEKLLTKNDGAFVIDKDGSLAREMTFVPAPVRVVVQGGRYIVDERLGYVSVCDRLQRDADGKLAIVEQFRRLPDTSGNCVENGELEIARETCDRLNFEDQIANCGTTIEELERKAKIVESRLQKLHRTLCDLHEKQRRIDDQMDICRGTLGNVESKIWSLRQIADDMNSGLTVVVWKNSDTAVLLQKPWVVSDITPTKIYARESGGNRKGEFRRDGSSPDTTLGLTIDIEKTFFAKKTDQPIQSTAPPSE